MRPLVLTSSGRGSAAHVEGALQVDLQGLVPHFVRDLFEAGRHQDARVVDEDIELSESANGGLRHPDGLPTRRDIALRREDRHPTGFRLLDHLLSLLRMPEVGQGDVTPGPCKGRDCRSPDAS